MSCVCNETLQNTGKPNCVPVAKVAKKLFFVKMFDDAGVRNSIDLTVTLDAAFFSAKINHTDPSKRWYPSPELKNITNERGDSVYQEYEDGSREFVREGSRLFSGLLPSETPEFKGKLESFGCGEWGVYIVDKEGNLRGIQTAEDILYPIGIESNSLDARLIFATDSTPENIQLSFQFGADELDKNLRMILASESIGLALLTLKGLIDVNIEVISTGTTSMVFKLKTDYGSPINPVVVKGILAANLFDTVGGTASRLYNVTDSAAVIVTALTENPDGTYTITYAAQTVSDLLRVTIVKTGFDATRVDNANYTVV